MSPTAQWICVTQQESIPLREGRSVLLGGHEVAIFNLGDRVIAMENRCPHRNGPLSEGMLSGDSVVCPLHSWKVCFNTGTVTKPAQTAACVTTYKTRVENGLIYVHLPIQRTERSPLPIAEELPMIVASNGLQLEL